MTTNPLRQPSLALGGVDPLWQLEGHVAKLNNYSWVRNSSRLFFIGQRNLADGTTQHFVERAA